MRAMIFAAGRGTRLKPITDSRPKALVTINDLTLLEWVIRRLIKFDIKNIIINVHHFADQIIDYLNSKNNFGINIQISMEDELLDTGGGLKKAAWFFENEEAFLVHNVDILSDINLHQLYLSHLQSKAAATLAVRTRKTQRYFLFDKNNQLCGWQNIKTKEIIWSDAAVKDASPFSFCGIHIISKSFLDVLKNDKVFSIIPEYLRLAKSLTIAGYPTNDSNWIDLGRKENFEDVNKIFTNDYFSKLLTTI